MDSFNAIRAQNRFAKRPDSPSDQGPRTLQLAAAASPRFIGEISASRPRRRQKVDSARHADMVVARSVVDGLRTAGRPVRRPERKTVRRVGSVEGHRACVRPPCACGWMACGASAKFHLDDPPQVGRRRRAAGPPERTIRGPGRDATMARRAHGMPRPRSRRVDTTKWCSRVRKAPSRAPRRRARVLWASLARLVRISSPIRALELCQSLSFAPATTASGITCTESCRADRPVRDARDGPTTHRADATADPQRRRAPSSRERGRLRGGSRRRRGAETGGAIAATPRR